MIQIKIGFVKKLINDRDNYSAVLWVSHNDEFPPLEGGNNILRVQDNAPFPYSFVGVEVSRASYLQTEWYNCQEALRLRVKEIVEDAREYVNFKRKERKFCHENIISI